MIKAKRKIEIDVWIILLLILISSYTIFNLSHWKKENRIIAGDVVSYYGYLPATFIYDDVTLQNPNQLYTNNEHKFWYHKTPEGGKVFKTSMGMAILYSPFFFLSHAYSLLVDDVSSGFSPPYKCGIAMSSIFYLILGLIFMRKVLKEFYNAKTVALTLLFIGLGTNLYYYTVIAVGMPHLYLLAILSVFIYLINKWYKTPTLMLSVFLGLLSGLIILVRPTMLIISLFALFYKTSSLTTIKDRLIFYKNNLLKIIVIIFCAFLIWIPQLLYWKMTSGNYLFYSYTEEGFFFTDPQIFNVLFSFRKGWLLYTPMMLFALIGIFMMILKKEKNAVSVTMTVIIYCYIASCWWDWWFGGSFGYRTMIEMFPLLAFGLAFFIQYLFKISKKLKMTGLIIMFVLMALNLFQTRQAHEGLIHHDSMTKEAYFKIFFKLQNQISRKEVAPYLKTPDYDAAKEGHRNQ